jgi:hypothetical protein
MNMNMSKDNGKLQFDFSHLYRTETVDIDGLFQVTVSEIPHGKVKALQDGMFKGMDLTSVDMTNQSKMNDVMQRQLASGLSTGTFSATEFSDRQTLLGVQSWTLTSQDGSPVPVCYEAWVAFKVSWVNQIEKAVERLNPKLDKEFQS